MVPTVQVRADCGSDTAPSRVCVPEITPVIEVLVSDRNPCTRIYGVVFIKRSGCPLPRGQENRRGIIWCHL